MTEDPKDIAGKLSKLTFQVNLLAKNLDKVVEVVGKLNEENASLHKRVTMLEDDLARRVQNQ